MNYCDLAMCCERKKCFGGCSADHYFLSSVALVLWILLEQLHPIWGSLLSKFRSLGESKLMLEVVQSPTSGEEV